MTELYTYMIVDDEPEAIDLLSALMKENCTDLKLVATAASSAEAKKQYFNTLPDLLFMDIQIDEQNGFEIINELYHKKLNPHIIFVTAFNQYAVEAFKTSAVDYLLKPVDENELKAAVEKFIKLKNTENQQAQIEKLINLFPQKIRFNTRTGFILLNSREILYCEADRNYTKIFTSREKYELVSVNLSTVEEKLPNGLFWRISRSCIVNSEHVISVDRKKKNCVLNDNFVKFELPASAKMLKRL